MSGVFILLARTLLAIMFLSSGYSALANIDGTTGYFAGLGLQPASLFAWGVGIFELVAGALLVTGLLTRPTAVALALFTVAATFMGHYGRGGDDPTAAFMHQQALVKDIAVAGGLILLAMLGAGPLSVDGRRRHAPQGFGRSKES